MSISLIPDSAPFTIEQRAWLNGFLAGWTGLDALQGSAAITAAIAALPGAEAEPATAAAEEEFPWHDPQLSIVQRLEMAEGQPLPRKMMAAMAQFDCGACGYVCKSYAEAIASGNEKNLTLCAPGGKNTAKAIKQLMKEAAGSGTAASDTNSTKSTTNGAAGSSSHNAHGDGLYNRNNPFLAKIKSTLNLNKSGSAKHTSHVVIDLRGSNLTYRVGDALGVYPTNAFELVDSILAAAKIHPDTQVPGTGDEPITIHESLRRHYCLRAASEELLALLRDKSSSSVDKDRLQHMIDEDNYDHLDVLDALNCVPGLQIDALELLACLPSMTPRLYSIASSLRANPDEVHLTVGRVAYDVNGRERLGVASTMFADRVQPGDAVGVFVHAASDFTVPADQAAPMIMVGPGTGIAPFRAFLQERQTSGATGRNWLFFGDQCSATDHLYRDEFQAYQSNGLLTRLSTAFSRDQSHKVYVQDRMREHGAELYRWLEDGGYFFVCGDATRMAADVDRALHEALETHGQLSVEQSKAYVQKMKREKRYVRDVY
jgi:sulfite reductase (NADPH) flavoprotein alpha-component